MPHPAELDQPPPPRRALPASTAGRLAYFGIWPLLGALALGLALWARYGWIESTEIGLGCAATLDLWWCALRETIIDIHEQNGWGFAALGLGALAVLTGFRPAAGLGLIAGAAGLVLYNAGLAAVGLLLSLLRLLRP